MINLKSIILVCFMAILCYCYCKTANRASPLNSKVKIEMAAPTKTLEPKLNNPVLMNGSSFANYFQALYKLGRWDDLLKFTSKDVIKKYGKSKISGAYKKMDFAYIIQLKSKTDNPDGSVTLNYLSHQFATPKMTRINVVIENDTVKLLEGDFVKF